MIDFFDQGTTSLTSCRIAPMNRLSDSHPSLNDILKFCTSRNAALHQLQMFERWQDCIKLREFLLVRINFTEIQVSSYIGPRMIELISSSTPSKCIKPIRSVRESFEGTITQSAKAIAVRVRSESNPPQSISNVLSLFL